MSPAHQPYLILGLIALAVAFYKGVIPIPALPSRRPPPRAYTPDKAACQPAPMTQAAPTDPLDHLPSEVIALAFARAVRREAEDEVARKIAAEAGEKIKATFTGPFSEAAPAPAEPPK